MAPAALLIPLLLAGCGDSSDIGNPTTPSSKTEVGYSGDISEYAVDLSDGRTITCVVFEDGYRGGMDCEWKQR